MENSRDINDNSVILISHFGMIEMDGVTRIINPITGTANTRNFHHRNADESQNT